MPELYDDQQKVADTIIEFYKSSGQTLLLLEGWAGVGKTFTLANAVMQLQSMFPSIQTSLTAPTNKAVKVIVEMAESYGLNASSRTIYSSLGLVLDNNDEIRYTKQLAKGSFDSMDLVVIDEVSMLNRAVTEKLKQAALQYRVKVVMMGDRYQLPPVKETLSPVFTEAEVVCKLTTNRRQLEGNPILQLSEDLRNDIRNESHNTRFIAQHNSDLDQGIYVPPASEWYGCIKENFTSQDYAGDPDYFRVLAYTNKQVNSINAFVRKLIVGVTDSPFIVGERVLTRAPIFDDMFEAKPEVIANTDEELEVMAVTECLHPLYEHMSVDFKVWALTLRSHSGVLADVFLLHKDSVRDHAETLDKLAAEARKGSPWRNFWDFSNSFADLQPPHAMTIHRSQGSTYKNVFIDIDDCFINRKVRERNQLMYVGCSRASDNLIVLTR